MDEPEAQEVPAPSRAPNKKLTKADHDNIMEVLSRPEVDGDYTLCERLTGHSHGCIERLVVRRVSETLRDAAVKGNASIAAQILKLPYHKVLGIANKDPWLKAQVPEAAAEKMVPSEVDTIARKDSMRLGDALPPEVREEYFALARQNKLVSAEDWERLGMTLEQGERLIMAEKRATTLPLGRLLNVTQGQLMGATAAVEEMLHRISDRFLNGEKSRFGGFPKEYDSNGAEKNTERQWLLAYYAGVDRLKQMHDSMLKTRASMLDAEKKMKELLQQRESNKGEFGGKPLRRAEPAVDATP